MDDGQRALLRLYLADPAGNDEYFHDDILDSMFSDNDEDLNAAASSGWRMKAANVAAWYAVNLDGAFLSRQQVWEHCIAMSSHFSSMSGAALVNVEMDSMFEDEDRQGAEF
jgi:hypothetical protein